MVNLIETDFKEGDDGGASGTAKDNLLTYDEDEARRAAFSIAYGLEIVANTQKRRASTMTQHFLYPLHYQREGL